MAAGHKSPRDLINIARDSEDGKRISEDQQGSGREDIYDSGRTEPNKENRKGKGGKTAGN